MARHEVKCWPEPYEGLRTGMKRHEFRRDDRFPRYEVGDVLHECEWNPHTEVFTGRELDVRVTYVSRALEWGIPEGFCVMSVKPQAKPAQRQPKPSEGTRTCASCGSTVMTQIAGPDWKGVQPRPNDVEMLWFCPNEPCREAFEVEVDRAKREWGWSGCDAQDDTV